MAQREGSQIDLRKASGRLISEGRNKTPVGPRKLLSYKLEEVDLPQPKQITANGKKRLVTTVLRLSIKGKQHQPNSVIWIDDVLFPSPWEADGSSVATLIYDPSLLSDGATISVGSEDGVYDLPDPLKLPARFTTNDAEVENGNRVVLRTLLKVNGSKYERFILIHGFISQELPAIDNRYSLQVGRKFFPRLIGNDKQYTVEMSVQDFNELKDGARVNITVGPIVIAYLGRLDKKMLDR